MDNFTWIRKTHIYLRMTTILIVANVIGYLLTVILAFVLGINEGIILTIQGAQVPELILSGQIWRFVTAIFLHGGIFHLAFNMLALYNIGNYIETFYGWKKLVTIYVWSGVFAGIFSMIVNIIIAAMNPFNSGGLPASVGASGAIFGLIGILLGNKLKNNTYAPELNVDTNQILVVVVYNLLLGFGLNLSGGIVSIDNWAHIGGLLTGILLGYLLETANSFSKNKAKQILEKVLFVIAVIIYILAMLSAFAYFIKVFTSQTI